MSKRAGRASAAIVSATLLVGVMSGCSLLPLRSGDTAEGPAVSATPAATRTVYGFVLITDLGMTAERDAERRQRLFDTGDSSCVAPEGFGDIAEGSEVQVLGPSGVIATGAIGVGDFQSDVASANGLVGCAIPFTVDGVPEGLDAYGLHVGAADRPAYRFTASELRSGPRLFLP